MASKKVTKKAKTHVKRTSKKSAPRKPQKMERIKRTTKKMVDDILLRVSPAVERQIEQLTDALEKAPQSVGDLKSLGLRVLKRARQLSVTLSKEAKKHKPSRSSKS